MRHPFLLSKVVNGLCALASSTARKKEDSLGEKLSQGKVSFDDALSHIYPQTSPRPQAKPGKATEVVESVTIYEAYRGLGLSAPGTVEENHPFQPGSVAEPSALYPASYSQAHSAETSGAYPAAHTAAVPAAECSEISENSENSEYSEYIDSIQFDSVLDGPVQGQITVSETSVPIYEDEFQSQIITYDHLPAQSPAPPVQAFASASSPAQTQAEAVFQPPSAAPNIKNTQTLQMPAQTAPVAAPAPACPPCNTFDNLSQIQTELAQQILSNYTESVTPVKREVLDNIASASADYLAGRTRQAQPELVPSNMSTSMTALVDRIFGILEPYIHELNQAFRATDLLVTFTPPSVVNENVTYDSLRRPSLVVSSYRCRISTSRLALVIRGKEDRVDFFLLPVESVMGLSKTEDEHQPLMTFSAHANSGVIYWEVEEKPLTSERMEKYILLIFEHLMDLTREELLRRPSYAGAV